jgi:disulfide bond formation protein DsbB
MPPTTPSTDRAIALLNHLFLMAMLAVILAILAAALALQLIWGELPCPLCLLERLGLFGVAFGIVLNWRAGYSDRHTGLSLLFALFLLIVAARQSLLDIYPRPGHSYIGSAIFGLHMPVWSIVIALCLLLAFALGLAMLGGADHMRRHGVESFAYLPRIAMGLSVATIALCAINTGLVILQCGTGECHTYGYALLGGPTTAPAP